MWLERSRKSKKIVKGGCTPPHKSFYHWSFFRPNPLSLPLKATGNLESFLYVWLSLKYFFRWTAAFYETWRSRRENFSIESWKNFGQNLVFLVHSFLLLDLSCAKTCLNGGHYWVLMKLGDFIGKNAKTKKLWRNRANFFYIAQNIDFLKITPVRIS